MRPCRRFQRESSRAAVRVCPRTLWHKSISNPDNRSFASWCQARKRCTDFLRKTGPSFNCSTESARYEDVADLYSAQLGAVYSVEDVREFAASLDALDFWYKTPQEKNILYMQQTAEGRKKLLKSRKNRYGDLSQILFPAVNPDPFLTWLHRYTSFIYTWWFTSSRLRLFAVMAAITVTHWSEIGRDSLQFFNFSNKSWGDVGVFYILALVTMCWHEIGHGHACKHFGARVPAMGFLLIYLTPAFYTDTSEAVVKATSTQNFLISLAGVWSELLICAVATIVWWGTPPDTTVHSVAYMLVLITGIASVMINWNPLIKLDGYYMLCEPIELPELKESATLYASAWVKRQYLAPASRSALRAQETPVRLCRVRAALWRLQLHRTFCAGSFRRQCLPQFQSRLVVHSGNRHRGAYFPIAYPNLGELYEIRLSGQKRPRARMVRLAAIPGGCRRAPGLSDTATLARIGTGPLRLGAAKKAQFFAPPFQESWRPSTLRKENTSPQARRLRGCGIFRCNRNSN